MSRTKFVQGIYDLHAETLYNDIESQKLVLQAESLQLNADTSNKLRSFWTPIQWESIQRLSFTYLPGEYDLQKEVNMSSGLKTSFMQTGFPRKKQQVHVLEHSYKIVQTFIATGSKLER